MGSDYILKVTTITHIELNREKKNVMQTMKDIQ